SAENGYSSPLTDSPLNKRLLGWALPGSLIVVTLLVWQVAVAALQVPRWLLPGPADIATAMVSSRDLLVQHTLVTLEEVVVGFVIAFLVGIAIAIAISCSHTLERAIYPFVIASQTIPVIAIAPILLIWFGYGLLPKVIVVALTCFFPVVVNTVDGLRSVDPDLVSLMRTLGSSRWQLFVKAQLPASLPALFSGTKVAVAISVIGAVIGEWVGASAGLGYFMVRSASQFQTARVFGAIVVLSAMGVGLFALVALSEKWLLPWYHDDRRDRASQ
ncbi:MAG TPA: ABC transporter permease, partial [Chloroflexota bacterium]|nr:ABC transporter permease [Chloroflexota bacterium]